METPRAPSGSIRRTCSSRARGRPRSGDGVATIDALHDAAAVMRSHPAFEAPGRVVDAVRRMLATKATRTKTSGAPVDGDCAASALEDTPMSSRCAAD